jgi:hypothetical protein
MRKKQLGLRLVVIEKVLEFGKQFPNEREN